MNKIEITITDDTKITELMYLQEYEHIDYLKISSDRTITTEISRILKNIKSLKHLSIWQEMTRTALRDVFEINNLEILDLFGLVTPAKVIDTTKAVNLHTVNQCFSSDIDLRIFSRLPNLQTLRVHNSDVSTETITRFAQNTKLTLLDVEDCKINNAMAGIIATSKSIEHLDISGSKITGKGLAEIAEMSQLKGLDMWATKTYADDLAVLKNLQNFEYLSIGGYLAQRYLDVEQAIPHLLAIPNLQKLWVDNLFLTDAQLATLKQHIKTVDYEFFEYYDE